MSYKVIVPPEASRLFREFDLNRESAIRFWSAVHAQLPATADQFRSFRDPSDTRRFRWRLTLDDGERVHLFLLRVDDTTAPGHLLVTEILHSSRPR